MSTVKARSHMTAWNVDWDLETEACHTAARPHPCLVPGCAGEVHDSWHNPWGGSADDELVVFHVASARYALGAVEVQLWRKNDDPWRVVGGLDDADERTPAEARSYGAALARVFTDAAAEADRLNRREP
ncbi:hypothetical protein [Frondihabitans sp. VKM Ac-2883]|uniref:hypothetical protein n=1 Tax=Frondihabitans sp. VKM Ac-2883 TaxID=2783823 RepID=UPI00188B306E|nr:hypothetical protein [Frondihabitans sp. VKM Ac-2883]MBF4575054.1 hypothetical protein [Frondihabitans sp. VKM Ac-2883]